ncbi:MAG: ORF6N domain-containing protein [Bacteriovoracaceae bacterium]|nr:ORF6N domain-containing protein [Bacteriovoracaceae bacterium]
MIISPIKIEKIIYLVRGQKVMFDYDLAELYEVETKVFNQTIKRNSKRFPNDFMFQLTLDEYESLRSQIVTSKKEGRGGRRYLPYAFTEQGVAMLSSVLNSDRAIEVNISIMRTFVKIRRILATDQTLSEKIAELEKGTNKLFKIVFDRLDSLETDLPILPSKRKKIGLKK